MNRPTAAVHQIQSVDSISPKSGIEVERNFPSPTFGFKYPLLFWAFSVSGKSFVKSVDWPVKVGGNLLRVYIAQRKMGGVLLKM